MLQLSLIGAGLLATTIIIHAIGTASWVRYLAANHFAALPWSANRAMAILVSTAIVVVALHTIEIIVWAWVYQALQPIQELATFEEAVYFSFVTFTLDTDGMLPSPSLLLEPFRSLPSLVFWNLLS